MNDPFRTVGKNIALVRKARRMNQTELAALAKVNKQTIWRIESGKTNVSLGLLAEISRILNVSLCRLFDDKNSISVPVGQRQSAILHLRKALHVLGED